MNKNRIAFIVHRFGKGINGGAEVHMKMLADHLCEIYDIDILTTTIKSWEDRTADFDAGTEIDPNYRILRFGTIEENAAKFRRCKKKSKTGRKVRRFFFRMNALKFISRGLSTLNRTNERLFLEQYPAYSPDLLDYIRKNQQDYSALIFITYYFPTTLYGALIAPEKSVLIPTAHDEKELFFSSYHALFSKVRHIAFNTTAEKKLCENIFGKDLAPGSIVATGIQLKEADKWENVNSKYNLPDQYVLYLGRVTYGKINTLLEDFAEFKKTDKTNTKLVLTGGIDSNIPVDKYNDIIFTGFVTEEEKSAIIEHATLMVNPSMFESLSLLLLEGLSKGIPVLVNGKCDVLKEHCILSDGACTYYNSREDFGRQLKLILSAPETRDEMAAKGVKYVDDNYSWNTILTKFRKIIDSI